MGYDAGVKGKGDSRSRAARPASRKPPCPPGWPVNPPRFDETAPKCPRGRDRSAMARYEWLKSCLCRFLHPSWGDLAWNTACSAARASRSPTITMGTMTFGRAKDSPVGCDRPERGQAADRPVHRRRRQSDRHRQRLFGAAPRRNHRRALVQGEARRRPGRHQGALAAWVTARTTAASPVGTSSASARRA